MKSVLRIAIAAAVSAMAILSCSRGPEVIPKKDMKAIYRDMFLADAWLDEHHDKNAMADTTWFYNGIFEKHGYTHEDYLASVNRYLDDPKKYADMLEDVVKGLEGESEALRKKMDAGRDMDELADSLLNYLKTAKFPPFPYASEIMDAPMVFDSIRFETDSLSGAYRLVPVKADTMFRGPRMIVASDDTAAVNSAPADSLETASLATGPAGQEAPDKHLQQNDFNRERPVPARPRKQGPSEPMLIEETVEPVMLDEAVKETSPAQAVEAVENPDKARKRRK